MKNQKKTMQELNRKSKEDLIQIHKIPIIVVLDDVRSMHNVGSVFRTSDSFLIEKIILAGITPSPPHRDIHKTALGATETVTWQEAPSIEDCLIELKEAAYSIIAIEQVHNSISLQNVLVEKNKKIALIFGNEVNGVSSQALQLCDSAIEIPQLGSKHSLNVSVSAGIVLWHFAQAYL